MGNPFSVCSCSNNDELIEQAYKQRQRVKYCNNCGVLMGFDKYIYLYGYCKKCRLKESYEDSVESSGILSEEEEVNY